MSFTVKQSVLESAESCIPLHRGGEADLYVLLSDKGQRHVLKWYRGSFDQSVTQKVCGVRDDGIYHLIEIGTRQDHAYQVYDFVGGVASDRLERLPVAVALVALRQVVCSLRKVSLSHGDLGPTNVILSADSAGGFKTVVIDWGIVGPGVLAFAAPERFKGENPDVSSDIYSLGMLLFRWISGANLLQVRNSDELELAIRNIRPQNVSSMLYRLEFLTPVEISALEPVWDASLGSCPENRVGDLEEFDEILEIALDRISGGAVVLKGAVQRFSEHLAQLQENVEQEFLLGSVNQKKSQFPYKRNSKKNCKRLWKNAALMGFGIVLLVLLFFWIQAELQTPDVDDTGEMILKKSRTIDLEMENELLEELPESQEEMK